MISSGRWITSYVSEFTRKPRPKRSSQPDPNHHHHNAEEADTTNNSSPGPVTPVHPTPAETTSDSSRGSTHTATTNVIGSLSHPVPATPTKPGQVAEGYHIFESVSRVSKGGSTKEEEEEEVGGANQNSTKETRGERKKGDISETTESVLREGSSGKDRGANENTEEDTVSVYSDCR